MGAAKKLSNIVNGIILSSLVSSCMPLYYKYSNKNLDTKVMRTTFHIIEKSKDRGEAELVKLARKSKIEDTWLLCNSYWIEGGLRNTELQSMPLSTNLVDIFRKIGLCETGEIAQYHLHTLKGAYYIYNQYGVSAEDLLIFFGEKSLPYSAEDIRYMLLNIYTCKSDCSDTKNPDCKDIENWCKVSEFRVADYKGIFELNLSNFVQDLIAIDKEEVGKRIDNVLKFYEVARIDYLLTHERSLQDFIYSASMMGIDITYLKKRELKLDNASFNKYKLFLDDKIESDNSKRF